MDSSHITGRMLLPRVEHLELRGQPLHGRTSITSLATSVIPVRPRSRQPKSATRSDQEWEDQKHSFLHLYVEEDLPLLEVMKKMEDECQFRASRKQYNTKITQWRVGKNVKENEMRAVVRKERKRKMEDPPKDSVFRVRKHHVDSSKIERFKRDKGIDENDNNVSMLDAATPSEISCYTPQPENDETSAQGTGIVSDSGSWSHLSAVQYRTMPNNSCYNRPNLPFGLTLIDPPLSSAETALSASSSYPSYTTSDNKIDSFVNLVQTTDEPDLPIYKWFESFINHRSRTSTIPSRSLVADLVRRFIEQVDTYQAQRELGVRESIWSTTRKNVHPESEHRRDDCATCKAIGTLHVFQMFAHIRVTHPQRLPYDFDKGFLTSEMIQTLLPALDTVGKDALSNAISAAWIVASGGRFQDVDRVIQATIKELKRRSAWDPMRKKRFDLRLANFYISHGRYGEAEQILSDILKNKLPSAARMAATQDVEFFRETYFNSLQEGFLSCRDDKMTDEDLAYIREIMG